MKNPFRKTITQNLEKTIAAFAKRGLQLDAQRRSAQEALETATAARQAALLSSEESLRSSSASSVTLPACLRASRKRSVSY